MRESIHIVFFGNAWHVGVAVILEATGLTFALDSRIMGNKYAFTSSVKDFFHGQD